MFPRWITFLIVPHSYPQKRSYLYTKTGDNIIDNEIFVEKYKNREDGKRKDGDKYWLINILSTGLWINV
jgi:hypothetical protein